jgi:predicted PurR-regulated permease PerM
MTAPDPTNIIPYLMVVAPVAAVLAVMCWALWAQNRELTEKIYGRDMANLKTLEQMLSALVNLERQGNHNFDELRRHISSEVAAIKSRD